jgi:two-component system, OmpR family, heavy metal sensor histidine kinase CusS
VSGDVGSLRRTLTISVVCIVGVALAALAATVYVMTNGPNRDRFDERLADAGRAAAASLELRDGRWTLDPAALAAVDQSRGATALEVRLDDGSVLARLPPDGKALPSPPRGAAPRFETIRAPGGAVERLYQAWLQPRVRGGVTAPRVAVAVLRDTAHLERRLSRLRLILVASTLGVIGLAAVVVSATIGRSLRHVSRLSASIGSIDAASLAERLQLQGLPEELRPPFIKVNELLSRMERSLARERQFNADVSHELRTPLAGLRTILEVSASRDRPAPDYRSSLAEALEVVAQIEGIVENLILLARLGSGQLAGGPREEIRVDDLIDSCVAPYREAMARRGLRFQNRVPAGTTLRSDRVKLRLVCGNLLSNAAEYTAERGWIAVESDPAQGLVLSVLDSGPAIPADALSKLFDPFFRLDGSRSGGGMHYGIGLALVRGVCETLGYQAGVQNTTDGAVAFTIHLRSHAGAEERR